MRTKGRTDFRFRNLASRSVLREFLKGLREMA